MPRYSDPFNPDVPDFSEPDEPEYSPSPDDMADFRRDMEYPSEIKKEPIIIVTDCV